jgi:hypothetical protein
MMIHTRSQYNGKGEGKASVMRKRITLLERPK